MFWKPDPFLKHVTLFFEDELRFIGETSPELGNPFTGSENRADLDRYRTWEWSIDSFAMELELLRPHPESWLALSKEALETVSWMLSECEPAAGGYLLVERATKIKHELLGFLSDRPEAQYRLQLLWSEMPQYLSRSDADQFASQINNLLNSSHPSLEARVEQFEDRLRKEGRVHLLYSQMGGEIVRWENSSKGVVRTGLGLSSDEAATIANRILREMGGRSRELKFGNQTHQDIVTLSKALLPQRVANGITSLLITPPETLNGFPFEILTLEKDAYVPLAGTTRVAYLRTVYERAVFEGENLSPGLALGNSKPAESLARRLTDLGELNRSPFELDVLKQTRPQTMLLQGEHAEKQVLTAVWKKVPFLYFATHIVRDPEAPFLTYIPLTDTGTRLSPNLSIADIRGLEFDQCKLVVLSGCSSGVPYVFKGTGWVPSLGDAFLDSGVEAVISTKWRIGDEDAERLMSEFIRRWEATEDPEIALWEAKKTLLKTEEWSHPYYWGAYTISKSGL